MTYRSVILLFLSILLFACQSGYREEWVGEDGHRYYEFDRDTILGSLVEGDQQVFAELEEAPGFDERYTQEPTPWKLTDYLLIAEAMFNTNWQEPLADWQISDLSFSMICRNVPIGFESANIKYSKIFQSVSGETREVRAIQILPLENLITVHEETYNVISPGEWPYINLQKIKFLPYDALQVAEQGGGVEFREAKNNLCKIIVFYDNSQRWYVTYWTNGGTSFKVQVDPIAGGYEVIEE